jgi:putative Holliday junction resolvase
MKILGIDHGKKRVGVALSDATTRLALPLEVVAGKDRHKLLVRIVELVESNQATAVVVGHPLTLQGESGPQARQAEEFAERLRHKLGEAVPVLLWDERMTSVQVDRARPDGSRSKSDGTRDLMAAVLILQTFLDSKSSLG